MDESPELNEMLNAVLPFAQDMLVKEGGFYPFAVTMDGEGEMTAKSYEIDDEDTEPERVLFALAEEVRKETAEEALRAVALCWDARIQAGDEEELRDAVAVAVETPAGEAVEVFVPYGPALDPEGEGTIIFGDAVAAERRPSLFPGTEPPEPPSAADDAG